MLTVTDKAAQYVHETLKKESAPGAFRIVNTEEGYRFTLDEATEGDQIFEHEGENYLLLDTEVGEALSSATLDVKESPDGTRLMLSQGDTS
jgi:Fe-S cluster assembly iron-binding protein IscA